ncbi:MAG: NAD(P)/FAD-dependent oxidoreductase [Deltaproteobacteria bacterium]|nr:NAD(P)/FAD-dependent oxidoreductase [Deltaproteobacteria bacterium]
MDTFDTMIIGAGVVGLAVAREVAGRWPGSSIVVLEQHARFGQETSSRNSEVIHAGMYYPTGSLKARLCVEGNRLLYDYCRDHGVAHARMGKLIVARDESETSMLETILEQGRINGVAGLRMLGERDVRRMEPEVNACAAIYSETTGVVDSHGLMASLEAEAVSGGAVIAYNHCLERIEPCNGGYRVCYRTVRDIAAGECRARRIINCAGLGCEQVAAGMGIDTHAAGYRLHYCKGEYFRLAQTQAHRIRHLIYPPPFHDLRGLGIHVVRRMDGSVALGPSAEYVDTLDYTVDPTRAREFFESARRYLPFIRLQDVQPDMAGIRPKLQEPGGPIRDFVIADEAGRGLPGVINLMGIESPGLTACLSIARMVAAILRGERSRT